MTVIRLVPTAKTFFAWSPRQRYHVCGQRLRTDDHDSGVGDLFLLKSTSAFSLASPATVEGAHVEMEEVSSKSNLGSRPS